MRRVSLIIAVVGFNLMACCCGGVVPKANNPNAPQAVVEGPGGKKPGGAKVKAVSDVAGPGVAAYDAFPEPFRGQLIEEWKKEVGAVRAGIEADKAALGLAKIAPEREKYNVFIRIRTERLARLQKNDPPFVTKEAAERVTDFLEKSSDKEILEARAKRNANAEAETKAKNEANRKAYEADLATVRAAREKEMEDYRASARDYAQAMKLYEAAKAEYDAAKELNLARSFNNGKTVDVARRRFREVISKYPDTQGAKDAKVFLDDGYVNARPTPPQPVAPTPFGKYKTKFPLPREPERIAVVVPPDPVAKAVADAASRSEIAMAPDAAALRRAEDEAAAASRAAQAEAARRAEEETDSNGLVLLNKTLKGVQNQFSLEITGTVVNRRDRTLSYTQIIFNVYDETGAQVGSAIANINGLESGGRWNFKAVSLGKGTSYKFSKLTGF